MRTFLYARVSTEKQKLARQTKNLTRAFPDGVMREEKYTGTTGNRPVWRQLLSEVKSGDTICFDEVSRMSRNAEDGFNTYMELYDKGVNLVFLKEPHINTESYRKAIESFVASERQSQKVESGNSLTDELLEDILKAVNRFMRARIKEDILNAFQSAQKEVDYLRMRTKEGIKARQDAGYHFGAVPGKSRKSKKEDATKDFIKKKNRLFGGYMNDKECMAIINVCPRTYYKYKAQLRKEMVENGLSI